MGAIALMDPLSISASTITVLCAAGSCCQFIHKVIVTATDAPHDIRIQAKKLEALLSTIECLITILDSFPKEVSIDNKARHVIDEFAGEARTVKSKIERKMELPCHSRTHRIQLGCKWLLDRRLHRFLATLEHWHVILSQTISVFNM